MSAADERNIQYSPTTDSQEDRWTLQYETNEQQIRDYKRQRDLDEFEIKVKTEKLAELHQLDIAKAGALAKSQQIRDSLHQAENAARQNANQLRFLCENQCSIVPQFQAQLVLIGQYQQTERLGIIAAHEDVIKKHVARYHEDPDVEQSSQLKAQLATVEADLTDSRQQLTAQEIALRQLHADFAQCQQQRIVALVGQAVQHRNQHSELDTVDRQHRQLRERIAERQRLLQSYEQQKEELQAQMQDLKRQQHIKDGTVEVLAVEALPELSSPEVDHPAAATIATATNNVEDFCLEAELDQMNISGELQAGVVDASLPQQQPAVQIARQVHGARIEARRVSFNPTEKVRAIAANGEESPSQLDRSEADYEMPSKQLLQTNDIADDGVQNDPAVAIQSPEVAAVAETETVQFEDMNDSFMCALADAVVVPISSGPVVAVPPPPVDERAKATVADGLTDRLDGNDDDDDDSFMCALVNSDSMSARIDQPTEQPQKTSDVAAHNESFMRGLDDGDRISAPQRADESIEEVENEEPNRRNASLLDESLSAAFFEEDTSVMMDRDGGVADFDLFGTNTVAGADGSNNGAPPEKRRRLDDAPINALNASSFRSGDFEFEFNGFDGDAAAAAAADAPTGGTEETDADATLNRSRANSLFNFDGDFAYNHQDDAALF